jgi:hypothetical protein
MMSGDSVQRKENLDPLDWEEVRTLGRIRAVLTVNTDAALARGVCLW